MISYLPKWVKNRCISKFLDSCEADIALKIFKGETFLSLGEPVKVHSIISVEDDSQK